MKFPEKCPYCGKDITEHHPENNHFEKYVGDFQAISAEVHRCPHCENPFYICREYRFNNGTPYKEPNGILACFPIIDTLDYPIQVKELSEQAYTIFQDAYRAYQSGLITLVGGGVRMALEHLVFDYLTKIQKIPTHELAKMQPSKRMQEMEADEDKKARMRFIHLLGNDSIHAIPKYDFSDDELDTAISAYKDLCVLIDMEITKNKLLERLSNLEEKTHTPEK